MIVAEGAPDLSRFGGDEWEVRTVTLRIGPSDGASAPEIARIAADPLVCGPYFVGRPHAGASVRPAAAWEHQATDWVARALFTFAVRTRAGGTIGCVRFEGRRLSYFLEPSAWRLGCGFEMVEAACRHYPRLLHLEPVYATVLRDNVASRRILEKTGFVFKGLASRRMAGGPGTATMLCYELAAR